MNNAEDFLAHYGKLGMKWGHRKTYADRVTNYKSSLEKNNGNLTKAKYAASGKFIAKYAALKLAKIAVNKATRGVGYYNPKSMRGIAFQMNPIAAQYVKNLFTIMQAKSYWTLIKDGYAMNDAKLEYDKEQRKKAREAKNG